MRRLNIRPVAVGFHVVEWVGPRARSWAAYRHVHNIHPWVIFGERRDALLLGAISPVSGMMVFDYGLECAHLSPMRDVAF